MQFDRNAKNNFEQQLGQNSYLDDAIRDDFCSPIFSSAMADISVVPIIDPGCVVRLFGETDVVPRVDEGPSSPIVTASIGGTLTSEMPMEKADFATVDVMLVVSRVSSGIPVVEPSIIPI